MNRHIRLLSAAAVLLVLSAPVITQAQDVRRQRLINKSYDVTADDKLEIDNQFGNVVVSTWDKEQITVDIEVSAKASTEERAQDIMNKIDVKDSKDGHTIWFKTKVDEIHNSDKIENSFGKTEIPAFKGLVTLTSKFGSLNTGKLDNVDQIDVEFGKAYITSVNNGKVLFKFNKESRIGKVDGSVRISSEFSQNVQIGVADNIQDLQLSESYSGVRLVVAKDLSAEFEVHTSFGHFNNESDFEIDEHKEDKDDYGPHFDKDYSGKAGEGKGRIKIKSSFGTVRLSHSGSGRDGDDDDDDKDKGKDKDNEKEG
jgi:hypothetical protein